MRATQWVVKLRVVRLTVYVDTRSLLTRGDAVIATAQALSSVYMLRTTSNSPHAWTFYYSSFASFYYLLDSLKLRRNPRRV